MFGRIVVILSEAKNLRDASRRLLAERSEGLSMTNKLLS